MGASPIDPNMDANVAKASSVWAATGFASRNRCKFAKCLYTVFSNTSGSTPSSSMVYCVVLANSRSDGEWKIDDDVLRRWCRPRRFPWQRISADDSLHNIMTNNISRSLLRRMQSTDMTIFDCTTTSNREVMDVGCGWRMDLGWMNGSEDSNIGLPRLDAISNRVIVIVTGACVALNFHHWRTNRTSFHVAGLRILVPKSSFVRHPLFRVEFIPSSTQYLKLNLSANPKALKQPKTFSTSPFHYLINPSPISPWHLCSQPKRTMWWRSSMRLPLLLLWPPKRRPTLTTHSPLAVSEDSSLGWSICWPENGNL